MYSGEVIDPISAHTVKLQTEIGVIGESSKGSDSVLSDKGADILIASFAGAGERGSRSSQSIPPLSRLSLLKLLVRNYNRCCQSRLTDASDRLQRYDPYRSSPVVSLC